MRNTLAVLGALLLLAGCNDDDPSPAVVSAPPADVEGQWEVTLFVTMDSCGFNLELTDEAIPVMLHQSGSDEFACDTIRARFKWNTLFFLCGDQLCRDFVGLGSGFVSYKRAA